MIWAVVTTIALLLTLRLYVHNRKLRGTLTHIADAASNRSVYIAPEDISTLNSYNLQPILDAYHDLLKTSTEARDRDQLSRSHFDQVLGNIPDVVFTINPDNRIVYANKATDDILNAGESTKGTLLPSLIQNPATIEFVIRAKSEESPPKQEVAIRSVSGIRWFEISSAHLPETDHVSYGRYLFLLHDITRLKELEEIKDQFVANVSHELKTPITIIKGFAESMHEDFDNLPPETARRFLSKIQNNTERLHLLVEDLLTLSRIGSDRSFLKPSTQALDTIIPPIIENLRLFQHEGQSLVFVNNAPGIVATFDPLKISQVFHNLLDNAIRYAGPGAQIITSIEQDSKFGNLSCTVVDNGPGVPAADLPHIFRRFFRVNKARTRSTGGTGLGLSIARGIVELHGGEIRANPAHPRGLEIQFTLPIDGPENANSGIFH